MFVRRFSLNIVDLISITFSSTAIGFVVGWLTVPDIIDWVGAFICVGTFVIVWGLRLVAYIIEGVWR